MSRAVTGDHVLFDECIDAFRREANNDILPETDQPSQSVVLTAFKLDQAWDLGICVVHPSKVVKLPGAYSAFVSEVDNPRYVGMFDTHLFGIALSAIMSFITHKPCKSTRDWPSGNLHELAIMNPILTAGPGADQTLLSSGRQASLGQELKTIIELLQRIEYKRYLVLMRSIRLTHLSIINKKDDFGLAYLLVVSAIEAIAQKAIQPKEVKTENPSEKAWEERAHSDELFKQLYKVYKEARGQDKYLKKRYIRFILQYAPVDKWEEYVLHPRQESAEYIQEVSPSSSVDYWVQKSVFEKYPGDIESSMIEKILADSYTHRSGFIHQGEQPPHRDPNPITNRFFQVYRKLTSEGHKEIILPNYELLLGLAKNSIINWFKE